MRKSEAQQAATIDDDSSSSSTRSEEAARFRAASRISAYRPMSRRPLYRRAGVEIRW